MKKMVLLGCMLAFAAGAEAQQDATQFEMKKTICAGVAMSGSLGFLSKATHEHHDGAEFARNDYMRNVDIWAFNYGRDVAASDDDARRVAFGKCWDKLDRAARRAKNHEPMLTLDEVAQSGD
ncbi:hypothetical protein ACODYM_29270 [Burkholderia gladioli]|uniref:hypothetical protein n=1 Tax=Burkholderia gladioli TaxID=28095 RepID=UPI003B50B0FE